MQFGNALLLKFIAVIFSALAIGTVLRLVALRRASTNTANARCGSLKTWWVLAALMSLAALMGEFGIIFLLATAGTLGLREFLKLIGWQILGTPTVIMLFASIPIYYLVVWFDVGDIVRWTAPIVFLIAIASTRSLSGLMAGYIRTTGGSLLGWMLFVYGPSYAYFVTTLSKNHEPAMGAVGWFLYLVLLTEGNDIAQALIGRAIGKTKIIPYTSPNKSLEGLLGGIVTTVGLAVALAPWLTTWTFRAGWTGIGVRKPMPTGVHPATTIGPTASSIKKPRRSQFILNPLFLPVHQPPDRAAPMNSVTRQSDIAECIGHDFRLT